MRIDRQSYSRPSGPCRRPCGLSRTRQWRSAACLLDKLFRGAENLLFVETKTKRHRIPDSSLDSRRPPVIPRGVAERVRPRREIPGRNPAITQTSRSNVIVRRGVPTPTVTDDYQGLPKGSVRPVSGIYLVIVGNHRTGSLQPYNKLYPAIPVARLAGCRLETSQQGRTLFGIARGKRGQPGGGGRTRYGVWFSLQQTEGSQRCGEVCPARQAAEKSAEYEKVLRARCEKDLTVNNTIGDLYARLGDSAKAIECFKSGRCLCGAGLHRQGHRHVQEDHQAPAEHGCISETGGLGARAI